jgi:hypothetical protein
MKNPCYWGFSFNRDRPVKPCIGSCNQGRSWDKCMLGKHANNFYYEKGLSYKQRTEKDPNFVSENEIKIDEENERIRLAGLSQIDRIEEKLDKLLEYIKNNKGKS